MFVAYFLFGICGKTKSLSWITSWICSLSEKCFKVTSTLSGNIISLFCGLKAHILTFFFFFNSSHCKAKSSGQVFGHLDFKLVVEPTDAPSFTVVLLAPSRQEKAAWTSDISQVAYYILYLVCYEILFYSVFLRTNSRVS